MKATHLFLTIIGLVALIGGPAIAEPARRHADSNSTSAAGQTASNQEAAPSNSPSTAPANSPIAGKPPAGGVNLSDAIAVESQPLHHRGQNSKNQMPTGQVGVGQQPAQVVNVGKGKVSSKVPAAVTLHNPAMPWGLSATASPHDHSTTVSKESKESNTPAKPWVLPKTVNTHDRVATVSKEANMPATPWGLSRTPASQDHEITLSKDPRPELRPVKSESLPTAPTGLPADSRFTARTNNIDRQHSPGLVAIGGTKFPSLAKNTVALNGTTMKHKP